MTILLTTNPGLESFVVSELAEYGDYTVTKKPYGFPGHVLVEEDVLDVCYRLRSIHHVLIPMHRFAFSSQDEVLQVLKELDIAELAKVKTFRVTCNRSGTHQFSSMDMQRDAGAILQERYELDVNLTQFDVEVRIDISGGMCSISVQKTRTSLSKRHKRLYAPLAALKANVAYAMLRLAQPRTALLDPFCGSGTILLEAMDAFPDLPLYGSDVNEDAVEGAQKNAKEKGRTLTLRQADARGLIDAYAPGFDAIVTNPPYGVRLGKRLDYRRLYDRFLRQAYDLLQPDGKLVILVFKRKHFRDALRTSSFRVVWNQVIELGGIYPKLYALTKEE